MNKFLSAFIIIFLLSCQSKAQNVDIQAGIWYCNFNAGGNGGSSEVSFVDVDELGRYYCVGSCMQSNQGFAFNEYLGAGQNIRRYGMFKTKMGKSHFGNVYHFYYNDGGTLCKNGSYTDIINWDTSAATLTYPLNINMYEDYQENVYLYKKDTIKKYDINRNYLWMIKTKATYVTGDLNNNIYVAGDSISRFDQNGNPQWYYPAAASKLVIDNKGNTYFRHAGNYFLTKIDSSGNLISTGPLVIPYYAEFAVDTNDNIYVLNGNQVQKYDSSGLNLVWTVTLSGYSAISADAHQNCYLAGYSNNTSAYPPYGLAYYARISSLQPPDTITCYLADTIYCAGDSAEVYFNTSPLQNSGAKFNVFLSDSTGNFPSNSFILGTGLSSPVKILIPYNLSIASTQYRMMVKVSPVDTNGVNIPSNYITINPKPIVSITPSQNAACKGDSAIFLALSPQGGVLSGSGVFGNYFYPDSVTTAYSNINYTYTDSNMCSNFATKQFYIGTHAIPLLALSDDTVCLVPGILDTVFYDASLSINTNHINGNNPFVFSTFVYLNAGINEIKVVRNDYGCKDSIIDYVYAHVVNPIAMTVSEDTVCRYSNPVLLTGIPPGGTFFGNHVVGNYFYPDSTIIYPLQFVNYSYTDSNACTQTTYKAIYVDDCLGMHQISSNGIAIYPNPVTDNLIVRDDKYLRPYSIFVNDIYGRKVMQLNVGSVQQDFNIAALDKGVYFLQSEKDARTMKAIKLVKQ